MIRTSIRYGARKNVSLKWTFILGSLAALICMLVFATPTLSQTGTSALNGVVTDQQGGAVVGANVTLTNVGTNASRTTQTSDAGVYLFDLLTPGEYRIEVEAAGFRKAVIENAKAPIGKQT
jgi:Carboxypeptidase regulatory-like domain